MDPLNTNQEEDESWPLSGEEPYFSMILYPTHVKPKYQMGLPGKFLKEFLSNPCPVVLTYGGKKWNMTYLNKKFDPKWKNFVIDNDLNVGDACVFEITKRSETLVEFRVQILRGDIPSELLEKGDGDNADTPIIIE